MDAAHATTIDTDNCARPHGDTDAMASSNYTVDENNETSATEPIATHATKDVALDTEKKKRAAKKAPPPLIRPDGKQIKKRKKYEDPRKPKKALPPYLLFVQDNRDAALAEHPGLGLPEVTKVLGARWLALPEAKKQEYYNRHDANRQMYEAQLAEFENENQYPCGACTLEVGETDEAVMCEQGCERWYHKNCAGLSTDAYILISEEPQAVWMCDACYSDAIVTKAKPGDMPDTPS